MGSTQEYQQHQGEPVVALAAQLWAHAVATQAQALLWRAACLRLRAAPLVPDGGAAGEAARGLRGTLARMLVRVLVATAAGDAFGSRNGAGGGAIGAGGCGSSVRGLLRRDEVRYLTQLLLWSRPRMRDADDVISEVGGAPQGSKPQLP
jgi:hypothetical protein